MNDFLAKFVLQNDLYALAGLIAALLGVEQDEITDIYVVNPIEPGEHIGEKECILDLKIELNRRELINIEIQARRQLYWTESSLANLL